MIWNKLISILNPRFKGLVRKYDSHVMLMVKHPSLR